MCGDLHLFLIVCDGWISQNPFDARSLGFCGLQLGQDACQNAKAKASCIKRILPDPSITDDQKEMEIATLYKCWGTHPHAVSSLRSSNRSSPPDGLGKDHGQPAQSWSIMVV